MAYAPDQGPFAMPTEIMVTEDLQFIPGQEASFANPPAGSMPVMATRDAAGVLSFHMQSLAIGQFRDFPVFNLRNGTVEEAWQALVTSSIPEAYHWVRIEGFPPALALHFVESFIQCALAQGMNRFPPAWSDEKKRKIAICLGVARASCMAFYCPEESDFIPAEVAPPMLEYVGPAAQAPAPGQEDVGKLRPIQNLTAEVHRLMLTPMNFSAIEREVIAVLAKSTIASPVLQGFSLVNTDRPYLSDNNLTGSRKAFLAVEAQFWRTGNIREWLASDMPDFQDMCWHKSTHPLALTFKKDLAQSLEIKEALERAGLGSVAARLPALESEVKAASAHMALFNAIDAVWKAIGGRTDYDAYEKALRAVEFFLPGHENRVRPVWLPAAVTSRAMAIERLVQITAKAAATAAYCFGFYEAMKDHEEMGGADGVRSIDTIRSAFSLKKLRDSYPHRVNYMTGRQDFSDYNAAKVAARGKSEFTPSKDRVRPCNISISFS